MTIKEIFHQLELSSKEKIYFDLLNRYTDGQELSDDERKFIKNFKKQLYEQTSALLPINCNINCTDVLFYI